jgi:hypothetical protein
MNTNWLSSRIPEVSLDQRRSLEIAKLVRKLRWIGKEDEAKRVEHLLRQVPLTDRPCVLAEPFSTD